MTRRERKYALDTNLYIRGFRDPRANTELQLFHTAFTPFEYLSAVVMHELRAGARGRQAEQLQQNVFRAFEQRGRVFAPNYDTWKTAGAVMSALVERRLVDWKTVNRSFLNDVLLATSCREAGIVLVTENIADFTKISSVRKFDFTAPWPAPSS